MQDTTSVSQASIVTAIGSFDAESFDVLARRELEDAIENGNGASLEKAPEEAIYDLVWSRALEFYHAGPESWC